MRSIEIYREELHANQNMYPEPEGLGAHQMNVVGRDDEKRICHWHLLRYESSEYIEMTLDVYESRKKGSTLTRLPGSARCRKIDAGGG